MSEKKRQALRERIASLINHGLSDDEIYKELTMTLTPIPRLIGIIREYMSEPKAEHSPHLGPANT